MDRTLVIGSTVIDIIVSLPHLPAKGEDVNITAPVHRLGGCAYNVYKTMITLQSPATLCSPAGSGLYGRMVREKLEAEGLKPFVNLEEENGCCYCLVDSDGERSFLSCHGAEYLFDRSWIKETDLAAAGSVYISGIDLEDRTGDEMTEFVLGNPGLDLYFAPGPRIMHIDPNRITKIFGRRSRKGNGPLVHLNREEASVFSGKNNIEEAAAFIAKKTNNDLVITMGADGCYCYDYSSSSGRYIDGFPVQAVNTTGAGDAHCGALIACLKQGKTLSDACKIANKTGADVVGG